MFAFYNPTSDSDVIIVFVTIILIMVCKVLFLFVSKAHKTFREQQHPRPAEIGKCEHWLSVAISTSDLLHGTLHHATDFQAMIWFPQIS